MSATLEFNAKNLKRWAKEELSPEFKPYTYEDEFFGLSVKHPLLFDFAVMSLPGLANLRLEQKKVALAKAVEAGNLGQILGLHERAYRLDALLKFGGLRDEYGAITPLWHARTAIQKQAEFVWTDSENIFQNHDSWLALYRDRPAEGQAVRRFLGDRRAFEKLPDPVPLYRGGDPENSFLSWTTDFAVATRFTMRPGPNGEKNRRVRRRMIPKADIFAYYTSRGESECLSFNGMGE